MAEKRRVVVTGVGALTPIGNSAQEMWANMLAGKSGAAPITRFDTAAYDTHFACELKGFTATDYMDRKSAQRMDPFAQYAQVASDMAVADAAVSSKDIDPDRIGVVYGSGIGGMTTYDTQFQNYMSGGPRRISPFFIPMLIPDIAAGNISIKHGFKGPNYATVSACATASHAIGDAFRMIQYGDADIMICGGSEAPITPMATRRLQLHESALHTQRPPGEGEQTLRFGARRLHHGRGSRDAGPGGDGTCPDAGRPYPGRAGGYGLHGRRQPPHRACPGGEGAVRSMRRAIGDAGISPEEIDYLNAHGTSTQLNDSSETQAIKTVFGERAASWP